MATFSDRLGITKPPKELQIETMNTDLRVSLWNWVVEVIQLDNATSSIEIIWKDYLKRPLHQCTIYQKIDFAWLHDHFMKSEWHEVYNFIEFVLQKVVTTHKAVSILPQFERRLESILERELAGYRVINLEFVPITDREEIKAIRQAMSLSTSSGLSGPHEHISKALSLLSKKPQPDYPNSIKESISAVESICKLLASEKSGGLDKALEKLSSKITLHPALKKAMANLYGYTSDESGIRHAILESKTVGFSEAKFMLVTCSALVNFVLETGKRSGLI